MPSRSRSTRLMMAGVLSLSGCADGGVVHPAYVQVQQAVSTLELCEASLAVSPQYRDLREHMNLAPPRDDTLMQQADAARITSEEAVDLLAWSHQVHACRTQFLVSSQQNFSFLTEPFSVEFDQEDQVFTPLIHQRISWGIANQRLVQVRMAGNTQIDMALSKHNAALLGPDAGADDHQVIRAIGLFLGVALATAAEYYMIGHGYYNPYMQPYAW